MKKGILPPFPAQARHLGKPGHRAAGKTGVHLVVERPSGADVSISRDRSERRNGQVDVLRAHAFGGHTRIRAQVLDGSVRSRLRSGQGRDGRHLGGQVEALEFGLRQANRAGDHQLVNRPRDPHIDGKRPALQF